MLAEKVLQIKLPAAHSVPRSSRRSAGLYIDPSSYGVLPNSGTKRITVLKTARGRAAPVGREEMDV